MLHWAATWHAVKVKVDTEPTVRAFCPSDRQPFSPSSRTEGKIVFPTAPSSEAISPSRIAVIRTGVVLGFFIANVRAVDTSCTETVASPVFIPTILKALGEMLPTEAALFWEVVALGMSIVDTPVASVQPVALVVGTMAVEVVNTPSDAFGIVTAWLASTLVIRTLTVSPAKRCEDAMRNPTRKDPEPQAVSTVVRLSKVKRRVLADTFACATTPVPDISTTSSSTAAESVPPISPVMLYICIGRLISGLACTKKAPTKVIPDRGILVVVGICTSISAPVAVAVVLAI